VESESERHTHTHTHTQCHTHTAHTHTHIDTTGMETATATTTTTTTLTGFEVEQSLIYRILIATVPRYLVLCLQKHLVSHISYLDSHSHVTVTLEF
jgi:hypothetical protein